MGQTIFSTHPIVAPLWQAVSRHLEIRSSTESCGELLAGFLPLTSFAVTRIHEEPRRVKTIVAWRRDRQSVVLGDAELNVEEWQQLSLWMGANETLHRANAPEDAQEIIRLLSHTAGHDDFVVAPLVGEHGSRGVLIATAQPGQQFFAEHIRLLNVAREAMAVALDNDTRLSELADLRKQAEADRSFLLRRLGRKEIKDTIVGNDTGLAHVLDRVELVGRSEVPALILGETGTGKELIARAIHDRSARHAGPFLRVNCGAIPRELLDSQLFGHERGSFTGATETRQGWFERADAGTLFLDEIGELPLDAQVRLLRVLQDGFIERVGGAKALRVDVRVVAATHRDLAGMVREGLFREDLWYRIAVFPLLLPPLRDRIDDIPSLVRHFAHRAAIRFTLAPVEPREEDMAMLKNYDWPGNIRELGAVVDRAAILGDGRSLELQAALGVALPIPSQPSPHRPPFVSHTTAPRAQSIATLNEAVRIHIEAALRATQGRVEGTRGAARILGINPHTLRARMRKLKINWSAFREAAID